MAYRYQTVPRHWNSYRPRDSPDRKPSYSYDNPNDVPLFGRSQPSSNASYTFPIPITFRADNRLPKLWQSELDDLMGRTSRAYHLVCHYNQKCPTGRRWSEEHIDIIRITGKHFDDDVRVLRAWQQTVSEVGQDNRAMMQKIEDDVEDMWSLCSRLQSMIKEYENIPQNHKGMMMPDARAISIETTLKGVSGSKDPHGAMDDEEYQMRDPLLDDEFARGCRQLAHLRNSRRDGVDVSKKSPPQMLRDEVNEVHHAN